MALTSIVFDRYNSGYSYAFDVIRTTTRISRRKKQIEITERNGRGEIVSVRTLKTIPEKTEQFFESITKIANLNWEKDDYSVEVCDGWSWTVILRYGRQQRKIRGTVQTPPYGGRIKQQAETLAENSQTGKDLKLF